MIGVRSGNAELDTVQLKSGEPGDGEGLGLSDGVGEGLATGESVGMAEGLGEIASLGSLHGMGNGSNTPFGLQPLPSDTAI